MISVLKILIREDVLTFLVGLSLFIVVFSSLINITSTDQLFQNDVFPINIYTKGDPEIPFFLGVILKEDSNNAVVLINEWEDPNNQSDYIISFSRPVTNIEFALQRKPGGDVNRTRILDFAERRHVPYSKIYPESGNNMPSQIEIYPKQIPHFFGVECNVDGIIRKVSSYQKTLSIPLKIDQNKEISGYRPVKNVVVQVIPPSDYTIENSIPEPNLFSLIGNHFSANEFAIDTTKTDLFILYENRFIERDIRMLDVILGILLSLATFFLATGFMRMIAPFNISIFNDKEQIKDIDIINHGRKHYRNIRMRK